MSVRKPPTLLEKSDDSEVSPWTIIMQRWSVSFISRHVQHTDLGTVSGLVLRGSFRLELMQVFSCCCSIYFAEAYLWKFLNLLSSH